jgi:GAF domain-containing protein
MAETIQITTTDKAEMYRELIPQLEALVGADAHLIAHLSNVSAALKMTFEDFSWVGFYLAEGDDLILGPFQGKPACVRIAGGQGVCGSAYKQREAVLVPDVHAFPGHIACDAGSSSEIVLPLLDGDTCYGVLDVDSYKKAAFDETDEKYLSQIVMLLVHLFRKDG